MEKLRVRSADGQVWRGLLILIATLSLTVSLATRFVIPASSPTHTVKAVSRSLVEPQRQRLNRDAVQWAAPVQTSAFAEPSIVIRRVTPSEPQLTLRCFDHSPYNRPPPSSALAV